MNDLDLVVAQLVTETAPELLACHGVGVDTAAILLVAAGDNPERIRNEAAWANLCGVAPLEASSGKQRRHRLSRAGNRQANHALWRIVFTRMGSDPRTRVYVERRSEEGLSKPEIMRVLKRYVARETYRLLPRLTRSGLAAWPNNCLTPSPGCPSDRYADRHPNTDPTTHGLIRARPHPSGPSLVCQQRREAP